MNHDHEPAPSLGVSATRRRAFGLAGGGLLTMIGSAGQAAAPQARRQRKTRVVRRKFTSDGSITIVEKGPANPYPSTLTVSGFQRGRVLDVDVELFSLTHNDPNDIDMMLEAPTGRRVLIMSDVGTNGGVTDSGFVIDDAASRRFPASGNLTSGRFRPTNFGNGDEFPAPGHATRRGKLRAFDGINPNGEWRLFIVDDTLGSTGGLFRWSLSIRARVKR